MSIDVADDVVDEVTSLTEGPSRRWRIGLIAVAVLPVVTSIIRSLRDGWFPIGDNALLYIRAADVFTEHHPLLGSWTSASLAVGVNMNNPGSIYDLLMSPFARTLSPGPGAAIGVGMLNIGSIIGIAMISRYIGGWRTQRWMLAAAACLAWAMGSELVIDIWQAHALLLPFLFFLVLMVGCTVGRPVCIPWAVFVGSVLIQTHISYAYILSVLIATALAVAWFVHRPVTMARIGDGIRSRTAAVAGVVFVLVWFQTFVEQLFGEGQGNLTRLATNSGGGDLTLGLTDATKITSSIVALPWWWTRWGFSTTVESTPLTRVADSTTLELGGLPGLGVAALGLVVVIGVLVALTVAAHRRGLTTAMCAGALATVAVPATVISLSLLTIGPVGLSAHHVRWVWTLSVFVTFTIVWIATELWTVHRASSAAVPRWLDRVAVGLIVVVSIANLGVQAHPEGPVADYDDMAAMRRVLPEVGILADHDPVLYDTSNVTVFEPYSSTMMMRMQELGIEFRVDDEGMVRQLGNARRADGTETTTVFQLEGVEALNYDGPACTVGLASAFDAEQDAEIRALSERLAADVADGTIVVDEARLDESDPIDQLAVARSGDDRAAWLLVIDGSLARWVGEGIATAGTELPADIDRVMRWMLTTYGLFAEGPWPCP